MAKGHVAACPGPSGLRPSAYMETWCHVIGDPLIKAELARAVSATVSGQHLSQTEAADVLGVDQPRVVALFRGRLNGSSVDRLLRFPMTLERDSEIVLAPKKRQ